MARWTHLTALISVWEAIFAERVSLGIHTVDFVRML